MVFGFGKHKESYDQVYGNQNERGPGLGQEVLAGGAAMAGFKAFEDHQRKEGKPISHAFAKEILAGLAGAEVDKIAARRGDDFFDREEAKRSARRNAEQMYDEYYIQNQGADMYDPNVYDMPQGFGQALNCWHVPPTLGVNIHHNQTVGQQLHKLIWRRELERELVPEWRAKYLDYKQGKKKLKAIARALRNVSQTPHTWRRGPALFSPASFEVAPKYAFLNRDYTGRTPRTELGPEDLRPASVRTSGTSLAKSKANGSQTSLARGPLGTPEEQPLKGDKDAEFPGLTRYGTILGSPPRERKQGRNNREWKPPALELPDPALDLNRVILQTGPELTPTNTKNSKSVENAFEIGKTKSPNHASSSLPTRYQSIFTPKRVNSTPGNEPPRPLLRRVLSVTGKGGPSPEIGDVPLEAYREVDIRQEEFFRFLDMELEKIEAFYKMKEDEATERLKVLREQLHIMRDRRVDELVAIQTSKLKGKQSQKSSEETMTQHSSSEDEQHGSKAHGLDMSWLKPIDTAIEAVKTGRYGKTSKAMQVLGTPSALRPQTFPDDRRDYSRRPDLPDVPYRSAKRKLKIALQEYYRGLELLKSYALLNRTAFRKINKKYDKTVNARPSGRYMTEKVNKAWFVQSDVLEGYIRAVEDLYARYFEHGNHKVAVGKLRVKISRAGDYTENAFRNGLTVAAGLVFGAQGLVKAVELLHSSSDNMKLHLDTSYLLQLPCFFFFLMGFFMWLNFASFRNDDLYIYYPVILICVTALIIFFPGPIIYHRSRGWLLYSLWRLFFAGCYPVEFRDFYLGDMFCSLTYSMGNIALFFCLYANDWNNPGQCNSSHSRLLGFFCALPAIWRALQCIRRYYDTRNIFPHLVNCGKYSATILYYVTLSIYRLDKSPQNRAIFITFATLNAIYCSIWDVVMDWSLGDPTKKFLRATLGYKKIWMYYAAMLIDPILRFNWVFYAVWPFELQHSAILSFAVSLSEVCRRGMWTLFRVENEHCTNVGRFRASRDIPLPYDLSSSHEASARTSDDHGRASEEQPHRQVHGCHPSSVPRSSTATAPDTQPYTSGHDLEASQTHSTARSRVRPRTKSHPEVSPIPRGLSRVGSILHAAHAQDFERKRKPELGREGDEDKADDDESEDEELQDVEEQEEEDETRKDGQEGEVKYIIERQGRGVADASTGGVGAS
ncbi:EXS-domain-containing protein [Delitschia confertaspora ATCC 74209]|uniref:EXS-domain-containing protein n=1 Tax=Delitschia confertaspora ATCC 74209 TaxID=1513339 RepID=A0A9P4JFN9_9PLEO|nr:EXS-domain-containing protein [Delitschia confertaspora ATCC 74209]